ncbi:MAG: helix-turn-helix domain-containing protein [Cytophagaceae bacterium]|nr:helix-turn-helix domain-containing protein [Cytophagaceae bacterium]
MPSNSDKVRLIFGLKVKHLRQDQRISLSDLATKSGLSVSYLNEIEKGKKYPKSEKIFALAKALDVDYDAMVSMKLSKKLEPIAELLNSNILSELPLEMMGLDAAGLLEMLSQAPSKVSAFISTIIEISRSYGMRVEQFYFSVLRSYQEMHDNHFEDIEQHAERFLAHFLPDAGIPNADFAESILTTRYGYRIERYTAQSHPDLTSLRSVLLPGAVPQLLINEQLSAEQQAFTLAREVGYQWLSIRNRSLESSVVEAESFDQVLNNFRASYFARAIQMPRRVMIERLDRFFQQTRWDETALPALLDEFRVTPEMLMLRMSNLLPSHFGIHQLFFLRFDHTVGSADFELVKEMHLSRLHDPHATSQEHNCRRWVSLTSLLELAELQKNGRWTRQPLCRAQVSDYYQTDNRYLVLTIAKPSPPKPGANSSITLGLAVDDVLRHRVKFLDDPALRHRIVNETCERCPIPDCLERVAAPTEWHKLQRKERLKTAVKQLQESNRLKI